MAKPTSPIIDVSQDAAFNVALSTSPAVKKSIPKLSWVPDKLDIRDHLYVPNKTEVSSIDMRRFCSSVENQGNLGSCTGHAVSSAMEMILKRQNRLVEISRLFIYYQARLIEGTVSYDTGAYLRDCIKACNKLGASAESLWKYDVRQFKTRPSAAAHADAIKRKVVEYQRCANFTQVKNALSNGNPVVVGFSVYTSFMSATVTKTGMMPYPNTKKERLLGGHAVCLVGYDDSTQRFIGKNSWGVSWGDRGYFYLPYQVIQNTQMSGDFWVITGVTAPQ